MEELIKFSRELEFHSSRLKQFYNSWIKYLHGFLYYLLCYTILLPIVKVICQLVIDVKIQDTIYNWISFNATTIKSPTYLINSSVSVILKNKNRLYRQKDFFLSLFFALLFDKAIMKISKYFILLFSMTILTYRNSSGFDSNDQSIREGKYNIFFHK